MARQFFNVPGDVLHVPTSAALDIVTPSFTVAVFVKRIGGALSGQVFANGMGAGLKMDMYYQSNNIEARVSDGGTLDTVTTGIDIETDRWHHLVMRRTDTDLQIFRNGFLEGSIASTLIPQTAANDYFFGDREEQDSSWNVKMAEIAIWNVALDEQEILLLSRNVSPGKIRSGNLCGYWPLDDYLTNGESQDHSQYANNMQLFGFTIKPVSTDIPPAPAEYNVVTDLHSTVFTAYTESATVYVDLQASGVDLPNTDADTVYVDLQPSTTAELLVPTDEATIYLDIRVTGVEEGIFYETFENMDAWEIDPSGDTDHVYITKRHATEGPSSLRVTVDSVYFDGPSGEFAYRWLDLVNGGDTTKKYWLAYSFYIEDWRLIWRFNNDPQAFYLPGLTNDAVGWGSVGWGPSLQALSPTTGQLVKNFGIGGPVSLTAGAWHTVRVAIQDDGTDFIWELWLDGTQIASETFVGDGGFDPPTGVWIGNDLAHVSGVYYIDDMTYSIGADPGEPSTVESAPGTTTQQWVKLREQANEVPGGAGDSGDIVINLDDTFTDQVTDAYLYYEVYISQYLLDRLASNEYASPFIQTDTMIVQLRRIGLTSVWKWVIGGEDHIVVVPGQWHRIAWHEVAGQTSCEFRLNEVAHTAHYNPAHTLAPSGTNFMEATLPYGGDPTPDLYAHINLGNMGYSTVDWVRRGRYDLLWDGQGLDPLGDANTNYPTPPIYTNYGPGGSLSLEEGGVGPGPGLLDPVEVDSATVYLDLQASGVDISSVTLDAATVYLDMDVPFVVRDAYGSAEFATVYLDLSVQGGECFSTAQIQTEGDAYLRWIADANYRWLADAEPRWLASASREGLHC